MPKRKYCPDDVVKVLSMANINRAQGEFQYTNINLATQSREDFYRLSSGRLVKNVSRASATEIKEARLQRFMEAYKLRQAQKNSEQKSEEPTI